MHVLVLDWGIGGIDTWARLRGRNPAWSTTYLSDAGFTPYGKVPSDQLAARLVAIVRAAAAQQHAIFDAVVVACNAMSTVLERPASAAQPVLRAGSYILATPTFGVIEPGIAAVSATGLRRVAIIGGQRTIDAGIHSDRLTDLGLDVRAAPAQPLSAHVEAGRLDGPEVRRDVAVVVAALTRDGQRPDALLLACTHYPALTPLFEELLPQTRLLDPVDTLVEVVSAWQGVVSRPAAPSHTVMTTGDPHAMRVAARAAFGVTLPADILALCGV